MKLTAERRVGDGGLTNDFSAEALLTISLQGPPTLSPSCSVRGCSSSTEPGGLAHSVLVTVEATALLWVEELEGHMLFKGK